MGIKYRLLLGFLCALAPHSSAWAFSASFKWCSGESPSFSLVDVPKGTKVLSFHMDDLMMASYNHGGGELNFTGQKTIACGALGFSSYRGPAPPNGQHKYRFTVRALDPNGRELGTASYERLFPE